MDANLLGSSLRSPFTRRLVKGVEMLLLNYMPEAKDVKGLKSVLNKHAGDERVRDTGLAGRAGLD